MLSNKTFNLQLLFNLQPVTAKEALWNMLTFVPIL